MVISWGRQINRYNDGERRKEWYCLFLGNIITNNSELSIWETRIIELYLLFFIILHIFQIK